MSLSLRSSFSFLSIVLTGFLVLVFLVGDWTGVYGGDEWMRVLWVVLLFSLQTFLAATWRPSSRWERRIGWGKWALLFLAGWFLTLAGAAGAAVVIALFVQGLPLGSLALGLVVATILLAQGLRMATWTLRNRRPVIV